MAQVRIPRTLIGMVRELVQLLRDPTLLTWALFVVLIPFYVFSNGLPQPGDMLVLPLAALVLKQWNGKLDRRARRPLSTLIALTIWVMVIDWGWALILGNFGVFGPNTFLLFPLYYVYNTLVFILVCVMYQRHGARFLWLTLHIVLFAVIIQTASIFLVHRGGTARGIGLFNNPNQLGFFALVSASIFALGKRSLGFGTIKTVSGYLMCAMMALASASRAALIGIGILVVFTVLTNPRHLVRMALLAGALLLARGALSNQIDTAESRFTANRYPQFSFLEERGYDRILNHKEYWLLGAGEGGTKRFEETTMIGATEIHSSLGTIFFCYGIVGIVMFGVFLFRVAERTSLRMWVLLLPTLSYTVAHQGLRSTLVWILFALFVCVKQLDAKKVVARRPQAPAPAPVPAPALASPEIVAA